MSKSSREPQRCPYTNPDQNQVYPPNLLAVLAPFVVNRSLDTMADIPIQSSNPNMCSLLQFCLVFPTVLLLVKGNVDTPLTVPHAPPECSNLKCLKSGKFAELLRVAVPCITWLSQIYRKRTYHPWWQ